MERPRVLERLMTGNRTLNELAVACSNTEPQGEYAEYKYPSSLHSQCVTAVCILRITLEFNGRFSNVRRFPGFCGNSAHASTVYTRPSLQGMRNSLLPKSHDMHMTCT